MAETLTIKIEDDGPPPSASPPTGTPVGGASAAAQAAAGVIGPDTVVADGRRYTFDSYVSAINRKKSEDKRAENDATYKGLYAPKAIGPDTVIVDGQRVSMESYQAAIKRKKDEDKKNEADSLYDKMFPEKAAEKKRKEAEDAAKKTKSAKEGALGEIANKLGLGGVYENVKGMLPEGAMAGLGSAAVAAAGPLAAVAAGAYVAKGALDGMRQQVEGATAALSGLAGNDIGAVRDGIKGIGEGLAGAVPILGDVAVAQSKLIDSIVSMPDKITQAFLAQVPRLSPYSGDLAAAGATADVRTLMADVREAQELGPAMARMVDAQSRAEQTTRELILPIRRFMVEILADRLELIADGARVVANLPTILKTLREEATSALTEASDLNFTKAKAIIDGIPAKLADALRGPEDVDLWNKFAGDVDNAQFSPNQFVG